MLWRRRETVNQLERPRRARTGFRHVGPRSGLPYLINEERIKFESSTYFNFLLGNFEIFISWWSTFKVNLN